MKLKLDENGHAVLENGLPVYKKELLETRNWDDKMYLYPIPQTEYYKNPNLGQNTGW